jgi:peptide/nickel transport system permease protein
MGTYIVRRLLWLIVVLTAISFITFLIFYVLPSSDSVLLRAGKNPSPELVESITRSLGLDRPWYVQYGRYMERLVLHLDFGTSYQNHVSVRHEVFDRLPATLALAGGALVLWLLIGIPLGIVSALLRHGRADRAVTGVTLLFVSAPVYWLGLIALYLLSDDIGTWPLLHGSGSYPASGTILSDPGAVVPSLILPWIVLAASFAAIYARFVRTSLVEVMREDYIRTARAKGLPERTVVLKHGMRAAITPIVTIVGLDLGILLGGAILTESVFNIPGVGRLAFDAIERGDLPMVQGTVLIGAFFIVLLTLVVDVLYAFLDPRVRWA